MPPTKVLIVSNPEDAHAERVAAEINDLGAQAFLLSPQLAGNGLNLSISQSPDAPPTVSLMIDGVTRDPKEFASAWFRRPLAPSLDEISMDQMASEFARDEWRSAFDAVYAISDSVFWVSDPDRLRAAERKPIQIETAKRAGLTVPRTLVTNDGPAARGFAEACGGSVVAKAAGRGWIRDDSGSINFVLTNRVAFADLSDAEIRLAPLTLQEEIPKVYEVRANVVGQQVLAIRIDSQKSARSAVDWRRYDLENTPYSAYQLPAEVEISCLRVARDLGLEFGAIDLIRRPDGEYVFLEINGNGQFLWAEQLSGVRVSRAVAELLTLNAPRLGKG